MKITRIAIFFCIFQYQMLFAQEVKNIWEPVLIDNNTLIELGIDKRVNEQIRYNQELVYTEIILDDGKVEYFKAADSVYYFRQFLGNEKINDGYLKKGEKSGQIDSVFTTRPNTYKNDLFIRTYYELKKQGNWKELMEDSTYWMGSYNNGVRMGRWFKSTDNINFPKYGEYDEGKLTTLYNPIPDDTKKYINWLFHKKFTWCKLVYYNDGTKEVEGWWLKTDKGNVYEGVESYGEFTFSQNGEFEYKHNSKYEMDIKKYDGKGTWRLDEQGNIELKFQNKEMDIFKIKTLSKTKLGIEKEKND